MKETFEYFKKQKGKRGLKGDLKILSFREASMVFEPRFIVLMHKLNNRKGGIDFHHRLDVSA
ncbi:hypothetical protein AB834_01550 [PVC group bacterium (ex Bugula neritina AB1)]|nr:hypothetical protein AB834_01550 [PVC group bacterium (ex Bugula neritina AB1)]